MKFRRSELRAFLIEYGVIVTLCTVVYFFAAWSGMTNHPVGNPRLWGDPMPLQDAIRQVPTAFAIIAVIWAALISGSLVFQTLRSRFNGNR